MRVCDMHSCVSVCFCPYITLSSRVHISVCDQKRKGERERLECDSCETLSESLGKSGSSRITVSCVYSCGAHEHTHIGVIKMHTWTQTCIFLLCLCCMWSIRKVSLSVGFLLLWICGCALPHVEWWYNEPGSLVLHLKSALYQLKEN